MPDATLHLEPCDHATAKAAVLRWHYSRRLPAVVTRSYAVHEDGVPVGVVVFGSGARNLGRPYGCDHATACELIRVALGPHRTPTSRIVAVALKLLRRDLPALRLVVSFADTRQGHHGGIYQAGGWTYAGDSIKENILVNGVEVHPRGLWGLHGKGGQSIPWLRAHVDPEARRIPLPPKHRYLMPLDGEMRGRIRPLARPYPKRAASIDGDAPISQMGQGGSIPTAALSPRREATHAASRQHPRALHQGRRRLDPEPRGPAGVGRRVRRLIAREVPMHSLHPLLVDAQLAHLTYVVYIEPAAVVSVIDA